MEFLPEEFYLRIRKNRRWGDSDCPQLPFFEGYRHKALLQHNTTSNHFRVLRFLGPTAILFDGLSVTVLSDQNDVD